jgi:hypothetical protein
MRNNTSRTSVKLALLRIEVALLRPKTRTSATKNSHFCIFLSVLQNNINRLQALFPSYSPLILNNIHIKSALRAGHVSRFAF